MTDWLHPGILLVSDEVIADGLPPSGWRVARMCGGGDLAHVLELVGRTLEFPDYYGQNMDAAWDCLTDLTTPTAVVWDGWQDFAVAHPHDWARLLGMFHERCDQRPDFAVVLTR